MGRRENILQNTWSVERARQQDQLNDRDHYTGALYEVQIWTNLVFDYAFLHRDITLLDQLAELYLIPLNFLQEFDKYWFYKGGTDGYIQLTLPAPAKMWAKETAKRIGTIPLESTLNSSQFLYLISHAIHSFVSLPETDLSANMRELITRYTPVAQAHYQRWIFASNGSNDLNDAVGVFQVVSWGCSLGRFNHKEFLEKKLNREFGDVTPLSYCNILMDSDMWIFTGAVELLAARKKKPALFLMTDQQEKDYLAYFATAGRLLEDRLVRTSVTDFDDNPTFGINIDPGSRKEFKDMRYAGYTGSVFPEDNSEDRENPRIIIEPADHPVPDNISFDTSHGRRLVQVLETLYRNRSVTKQLFPSKDILKGVANQVAYAIFNKDFGKPLFANYFDGSNGWYRVNYSKRDRFGFAPWDNSLNWVSCGFAALQTYQPDLKRVSEAVWTMINSNDPGIIEFRSKHYEHSHYSGGQRELRRNCFNVETSFFILNFIAAADLPDVIEPSPKLSINRTRLNFGAIGGSTKTHSQQVTVTNTGEGTLAWRAESDAQWLHCTPSAGINAGVITVSVDPGDLPAGSYEGTVTVSDPDAGDSPQTTTVQLEVHGAGRDIIPFGSFETPEDQTMVDGSVPVTGWALDKIEVEWVKVYREALTGERRPFRRFSRLRRLIYLGDALFTEDVRPDLVQAHPDVPKNYRAGWGYMLLTNALPNEGNGTFTLHVKIRSASGREVMLGPKTIHCDNASAVEPFGSIDTPAPGGIASGSEFRIHGWALTPLPNKIPEDGSTIKVYVDGVSVGQATYNIRRPDIQALFPGFANSERAHAYFDLDTTAYSNGIHTLAWTVTDNAGNSSGIGSRFFVIQN